MTPRGMAYATFYGGREREARKRMLREERQRQRALYELRRRKLIRVVTKGGRLMVAITEKGLNVSLPYRLAAAPCCPAGEYVVVTFDIPEVRRDVRIQLRRLLLANDFQMLHRSVWYTNRDVLDLLTQWAEHVHADPWIYVFRASHVSIKNRQRKSSKT